MGVPFTIDDLDADVLTRLRVEADRRGMDLNAVAAEILKRGLRPLPEEAPAGVYHDLDHLAGTWSEEEAREFQAAIAPFERVDEDLWR